MHAGLIPLEIGVAKEQARKKITDPAKRKDALAAIDRKIEESHAAFGELTDDEMALVKAASAKPGVASH